MTLYHRTMFPRAILTRGFYDITVTFRRTGTPRPGVWLAECFLDAWSFRPRGDGPAASVLLAVDIPIGRLRGYRIGRRNRDRVFFVPAEIVNGYPRHCVTEQDEERLFEEWDWQLRLGGLSLAAVRRLLREWRGDDRPRRRGPRVAPTSRDPRA